MRRPKIPFKVRPRKCPQPWEFAYDYTKKSNACFVTYSPPNGEKYGAYVFNHDLIKACTCTKPRRTHLLQLELICITNKLK
jgi:hypothetical protein